jgi:pimeloyl-ACP methyl ester carboxylesterase
MQHTLHIEGHKLVALALNPEALGEPIILLHGINLAPQFWLTDSVFVEHGPCFALSLPGHYPAVFPGALHEDELTAEMIARVLAEAVRQLVGERPVTLAGISTGGFASLATAAYAPELARRVISISGFAQGVWGGMLGIYQRWLRGGPVQQAMFRTLFKLSQRRRAAFRNNVWPYFVADKAALFAYPRYEQLIDDLYPIWTNQDMRAVKMYYRRMPDISIVDWLPRVSMPTLVMTGERDKIVPAGQSLLIAERVQNAELAVIPGAGHLLFAERPAEYNRILTDWLTRTAYTRAEQ